jgi:protein O-GlcNAc transferase
MPENLTELMESAVRHHGQGKLNDAKSAYEQVLAQSPRNAEAMNLLGAVCYQLGERERGLDLLVKSIELEPNNSARHANAGFVLLKDGKPAKAMNAYRRAVELDPGNFELRHCYGEALFQCGDVDAAVAEFRAALAIRPGAGIALYKLGVSLLAQGNMEESVSVLKRLLSANPNEYDALNYLAFALQALRRMEESIQFARRAIAARPDAPEAYSTLAASFSMTHNLDQAIECSQKAVEIAPKVAAYQVGLANALKDAGEMDRALERFAAALAMEPNDANIHSNWVYALHLDPCSDEQRLFDEARLWNTRHAIPLMHEQRPHENDRSPDRRLRIGLVSPDFHMHPVGRFIRPLLQNYDRREFEFICYSGAYKRDEVTAQLKGWADGWRDISRAADAQVCDMIRQDQIDILIDLTMHTSKHRLLVFARKPAPVQMTYLAYCGTTGLDAIDYRITDPYLDPQRDPLHYSEKSLVVKSYWCYAPMNSEEVSQSPARRAGHVTFGSLNNFCKNSAPTIDTWIRILTEAPGSKLLLHAAPGRHRKRLLEKFKAGGVDVNRIEFTGHMSFEDFMRLYHRIDVALDPFPYGGGTTSLDGLWMGPPLVTLRGRTGVGRGGASILSNLGLADLIAADENEYVKIAADLARDVDRVASLRDSMRERMRASPIMDQAGFARDFGALLRAAWRKWCQG